MASNTFDELTRALASSLSRRQTIKAIFVGALGGTLGLSGFGTTLAAGCVPYGGTCHNNDECCSHDCFHSTCNCKPKGIRCNLDSECCSGHCQTSLSPRNQICL